jgi:hypothetical protein
MRKGTKEFREIVKTILDEKGYLYWKDIIGYENKEIVNKPNLRMAVGHKLGGSAHNLGLDRTKCVHTDGSLLESIFYFDYNHNDSEAITPAMEKNVMQTIHQKNGCSLKKITELTRIPLKYAAAVILEIDDRHHGPYSLDNGEKEPWSYVKLDQKRGDLIIVNNIK